MKNAIKTAVWQYFIALVECVLVSRISTWFYPLRLLFVTQFLTESRAIFCLSVKTVVCGAVLNKHIMHDVPCIGGPGCDVFFLTPPTRTNLRQTGSLIISICCTYSSYSSHSTCSTCSSYSIFCTYSSYRKYSTYCK